MVVHTFNPSTQRQCKRDLCKRPTWFNVASYIVRPCLKKKKERKQEKKRKKLNLSNVFQVEVYS